MSTNYDQTSESGTLLGNRKTQSLCWVSDMSGSWNSNTWPLMILLFWSFSSTMPYLDKLRTFTATCVLENFFGERSSQESSLYIWTTDRLPIASTVNKKISGKKKRRQKPIKIYKNNNNKKKLTQLGLNIIVLIFLNKVFLLKQIHFLYKLSYWLNPIWWHNKMNISELFIKATYSKAYMLSVELTYCQLHLIKY